MRRTKIVPEMEEEHGCWMVTFRTHWKVMFHGTIVESETLGPYSDDRSASLALMKKILESCKDHRINRDDVFEVFEDNISDFSERYSECDGNIRYSDSIFNDFDMDLLSFWNEDDEDLDGDGAELVGFEFYYEKFEPEVFEVVYDSTIDL